jgi:CDP-glucose 4,6-dehydratase
MAFDGVYAGKKVLVTGNTGFKGAWLTTWLLDLGADVYGYSIDIPTNPSMYEELKLAERLHHTSGDVREKEKLNERVQKIKPDFIFHLAAQAIVSTSYSNPFDTITTNVIGTASVLESMRNITWECTCILITSDKAYDNVEWIWGYRENDRLGGNDIYSGSKGAAELTIKSYWHSFIKKMPNIKLAVARAGNVIGGGDWAKDRIIVDCIRNFQNGNVIEIRSPNATRPWQHVLEPLSGYLSTGAYLCRGIVPSGEAFNFGPKTELTKTVLELTEDMASYWELKKDKVIRISDSIPFEEAQLLKLNCDKALIYLNWHSTLNYEQTVRLIAEWYLTYNKKSHRDMYQVSIEQIKYYMIEAASQNLKWAL